MKTILSSLKHFLIEGICDFEGLILIQAYVVKSLRHLRRHEVHGAVCRMIVLSYTYPIRVGSRTDDVFSPPAISLAPMRMTSNANANRICDMDSPLQCQLPTVPPTEAHVQVAEGLGYDGDDASWNVEKF